MGDSWTSNLPMSLKLTVAGFTAALEGWRFFLHRTVPEELPCLAPGSHWVWTFFFRAHRHEQLLAWRLRVMGFGLMAAGVEVAFWQWEARLAMFGGMFVDYGLWAIALVGAAGFTA